MWPVGRRALTPVTFIQGNSLLGPLVGSQIQVFKVNTNGSLSSTSVAIGTTDAKGKVTLSVTDASACSGSPVVADVTGGTFVDEGTGQTTSLNSHLHSLICSLNCSGANYLSVTAASEFVYQAFNARLSALSAGSALIPQQLETSCQGALRDVGTQFGLTTTALSGSCKIVHSRDTDGYLWRRAMDMELPGVQWR